MGWEEEAGSCLICPFWFRSRVCTGPGLGGSWVGPGVWLGQPQFTSLTDPAAGKCGSRPGNVSDGGSQEKGERRKEGPRKTLTKGRLWEEAKLSHLLY